MRKHSLKERIEALRWFAARAVAPATPEPTEKLHICGLVRAREVPFDSEEEWRKWWLPERNSNGTILAPARMSTKEKERYTVAENNNILVDGGITQVLNYIGGTSGSTIGFAQYFAVGNIAISGVESNDNSVAGEYFRAVPSMASVSGTQQDLSVFAGTTQANGSITNAGLYGATATATVGSGVLMTHCGFIYTKTSANATTFDYLLSYE